MSDLVKKAPDERETAYDQGRKACSDGLEFWQNPYANRENGGGPMEFAVWFAGWCYQKQMDAKK